LVKLVKLIGQKIHVLGLKSKWTCPLIKKKIVSQLKPFFLVMLPFQIMNLPH